MKRHNKFITGFTGFIFSASMLNAAVVFQDDFQSPAVSGNTADTTKQRDGSLWVNAGTGFGADRHGVVNEDSGAFLGQSTPGVNDGEQAYTFRYTARGAIMSAAGATNTTIALGQVITLSFDAVQDLLDNEGPSVLGLEYNAYLLALDTGASRTLGENGVAAAGGTVLAGLTGSVAEGTTWETGIQLTYTVTSADSALFGQELAIAFQDSWGGNTTGLSSAMIDNVALSVIPEPSVALLSAIGMLGLLRRRR